MTADSAPAPGFWVVVLALLGAARRRRRGLVRHKAALYRARRIRFFRIAPSLLFVGACFGEAIIQGNAATAAAGAFRTMPGRLPDLLASLTVVVWGLMLVCQGENATLDPQRTRHPMWEWLVTHPAPPAALFCAEMLAPVAVNPAFLIAPLFPGVLFGTAYGVLAGVAVTVLVGIPVALAIACLAKSVELWLLLRVAPRRRGLVFGLMGWFGTVSSLLFFTESSWVRAAVAAAQPWLMPLARLPWPSVDAMLGRSAAGEGSLRRGVILCWAATALLVVGAVGLAHASTRLGLAGGFRRRTGSRRSAPPRFGRWALYRKDLLWLRRDGRALVQAVLWPLSLAAFQVFNMRGVLLHGLAWNTLCGVAIVFGIVFLQVLGPRSLAAEGPALWIVQTWPHGLEAVMRAKARLWAALASCVVGVVFIYAAWRFPGQLGGVLALALLWCVFARSHAEKMVTLATAPPSVGETAKPSAMLQWMALLGTVSVSVGVFTRQWNLAVAGVVYAVLTAAAMWEYFRARLPFLYDPWSETAPPPPTLLHAMLGIAGMIEAVSALTAMALGLLGRDWVAATSAALYCVCAIVAAGCLARFLARRGVPLRDIWVWREGARRRAAWAIPAGMACGAALGLVAHAYVSALHWLPGAAQAIEAARRQMQALPGARIAYTVVAVGFAPFAEEFLFRGLLYRALDRAWGGWRAVLGAAAFFAIYHPTLSWAPVALLGAMNALLYKRTGLLAPGVAAHMAYNAVVLAL